MVTSTDASSRSLHLIRRSGGSVVIVGTESTGVAIGELGRGKVVVDVDRKGNGMAKHTVKGTIGEPLSQVESELRSEAAAEDWSLAEGESGPGLLVFRKGVKAMSWGAELRVSLEAVSDAQTHVTIDTHETFALTDWGRGSRAAKRLLTALGADID